MVRIKDEESAQVIILFGFLIAVALIVIAVLLNTVLFSGHQTAMGEFTYPKQELQDIRKKTIDQVKVAANCSQFQNESVFSNIMNLYGSQITTLYAQHGAFASIEAKPIKSGTNISWAQVTIIFSDMNTDYKSIEVIYDLKERE